jgi:hypothetical protein
MINWITLNLPWCVQIDLPEPDYPSIDIIDNAVKNKFGFSRQELDLSTVSEFGFTAQVLYQNVVHDLFDQCLNLDDIVETTDRKIIVARDYILAHKAINRFIETIPEVIKWKHQLNEVRHNEAEIRSASCFVYSKYNVPCTIIVLKTKTETRKLLIGDVNVNGSMKHGDSDIEDDDIVLKCVNVLPLLVKV